MRKLAAIDIGTNSMRLMLCETEGGRIGKRSKELMVTRIGKSVSSTGVISESAMRKNIEALKYFKNKAEKFGAGQILAIATSAVRDAANREEFVHRAKTETGIGISIIDGHEEAELGIIGVMSETEDKAASTLVVDIGGGSTELILWSGSAVEYSISINAGAVRMTEMCISQNPICDSELLLLESTIGKLFEEALGKLKNKKIDKIIAIGGTATTLAAIYHQLGIYEPSIVHNTVMDINFLKECFRTLKGMSVKQRYEVKGLQKERADVIPAGQRILIHILETLNIPQVSVSENDNLEGAIIKYCL